MNTPQGIELDVFCITMALMVGTAGLPHVIISQLRKSVMLKVSWMGTVVYCHSHTTAPAIAVFQNQSIETVSNQPWQMPGGF